MCCRGFVKSLLVAVMLMGLGLGPVRAETTPPKKPNEAELALAAELFSVLKVADQLKNGTFTEMMRKSLQAMAQNMPEIPEDLRNQIFDYISVEMGKSFDAAMPSMIQSMAYLYAENFTEDELRGLINLFSSEVGQVYVDRTPVLTARLTQAMMPILMHISQDMQGRIMPQIMSMVQEYRNKNGNKQY